MLNNWYFVNSEVCKLYQAVNKPAIELKRITQSEVLSEKISSAMAYPIKNIKVAKEVITNKVENKFRIAFVDFEITKIFSKRKVVKIESIATKLKNTLYVPLCSGPYHLPSTKPPKIIIIWATVFPANKESTPLAFLVLNFSNFFFNLRIS